MAETVNNYQQGSITTPATNDPLSSSVVRGHFQSLRTVHNSHDAEAGVHFQSSTLASRPAAGVAGRKWYTTDGKRVYYDNGATWDEIAYLPAVAGLISTTPVTIEGTTSAAFQLNTTTGATSDVEQIIFKRGGANKWRIGNNIDGSNADRLNLYNEALAGGWYLTTSGHLLASADNTFDVGSLGATRPRDVHVGRDIYLAGQLNLGTNNIGTSSASLAHGYSFTSTQSVPGDGKINFIGAAGILAFFGATGTTKQTITGSRGGNAALADLLSSLASYGLITDSSSA